MLGVRLDVFQLIIVEQSQLAAAERFGNRQRDLCLGKHDLRAVFLDVRDFFLLTGSRRRPALLRFGLGDAHVGFGLIGHQPGADVFPDVDVGNVDRHDFVRGVRLESLAQDGLGNPLGVFHDGFVRRVEPMVWMIP